MPSTPCTAPSNWLESLAAGLKEFYTPVIGGRIQHQDNFLARLIRYSRAAGIHRFE
jgi:hypothetical protein